MTPSRRTATYLDVALIVLAFDACQEPTRLVRAPKPNAYVASAIGFTQLSLGTSFGCAVKADGSLACWGINSNGELNAPAAPISPK